ncbi:MAG: helix-turn-helix transcriptional regulator [Butyrivibrio sp.]|nr:helix-turn-helix transcriptional regulator [Butyrivibrio sp.]
MIHLSENLIRFRKEQQLTQSEVADHIGVTKASVSKWETGQTMPDVALLPLLASFYNVTLDELMGYEPLLSREQIQEIYLQFSERFAAEPFDAVYPDIQLKVRHYFSCCPFLFQMSVLLLNHCDPRIGALISDVRSTIMSLCHEVEQKSNDRMLCESAHTIRMMVSLQSGSYQEVIDELSDLTQPDRIDDQSSLLVMAYMSKGELPEAERAAQISVYKHLLLIIQQSMHLLTLCAHDPIRLEMTLTRIDALMQAYDLIHLHPNTAAAYYYQAAVTVAALLTSSKASVPDGFSRERVISLLQNYHRAVILLFRDDLKIHGDDYFNRITEWFSESALGEISIRSKKEVLTTVLDAFDHPSLQFLGKELLQNMKENLAKECASYV